VFPWIPAKPGTGIARAASEFQVILATIPIEDSPEFFAGSFNSVLLFKFLGGRHPFVPYPFVPLSLLSGPPGSAAHRENQILQTDSAPALGSAIQRNLSLLQYSALGSAILKIIILSQLN